MSYLIEDLGMCSENVDDLTCRLCVDCLLIIFVCAVISVDQADDGVSILISRWEMHAFSCHRLFCITFWGFDSQPAILNGSSDEQMYLLYLVQSILKSLISWYQI